MQLLDKSDKRRIFVLKKKSWCRLMQWNKVKFCNIKDALSLYLPNFSFSFVVLGTLRIVSEYRVDLWSGSAADTIGNLIKGSAGSSASISDIECMYLWYKSSFKISKLRGSIRSLNSGSFEDSLCSSVKSFGLWNSSTVCDPIEIVVIVGKKSGPSKCDIIPYKKISKSSSLSC